MKLAVYFKALACNVKRMVRYLAEAARKAAQLAAAAQKAAQLAAAAQDAGVAAIFGPAWPTAALRRDIDKKPVFRPLALAA